MDISNLPPEGKLQFTFPPSWYVVKYDDSIFYKQKIQKIKLGKDAEGKDLGDPKAMDYIALSPDGKLWLIEVKDFRGHRIENKLRLASKELIREVIKKTLDTLAGLWISHYLNDDNLSKFTSGLSPDNHIRVVLWLEEDPNKSRLNPNNKSHIDLLQELRKNLKGINFKGEICCMASPGKAAWMVENISHKT